MDMGVMFEGPTELRKFTIHSPYLGLDSIKAKSLILTRLTLV